MKLLLDTHTFMWWDSDLEKLSSHVQSLCFDPRNQLILSVVSIWEMQIKIQIGKLALGKSLVEVIADHRNANRIDVLPIYQEHVLVLDSLPLHHRDPFDRLLIAQANVENMVILSRDTQFQNYAVQVMWEAADSTDELTNQSD